MQQMKLPTLQLSKKFFLWEKLQEQRFQKRGITKQLKTSEDFTLIFIGPLSS